jgi:hypothetical protein
MSISPEFSVPLSLVMSARRSVLEKVPDASLSPPFTQL